MHKAFAGVETTFTVQARDRFKNIINHGDASLMAHFKLEQKTTETAHNFPVEVESRDMLNGDYIITFCAKSTWLGVQNSLMDGSLEEAVSQAVSKIQPVRAAFFRKSQLIQDGVVVDDGPTLEEIKAAEKAASEESQFIEEDDSETDFPIVESEPSDEENSEGESDASGESEPTNVSDEDEISLGDLESFTVAQLKELLKKAGKPVSGKKAELIARLSE